ncbi:MAG TPA: TolC family protein [Thermoanaerobaculia bacterium]|nr:TolC family protein [Thermoanaerobaculia bacterium]
MLGRFRRPAATLGAALTFVLLAVPTAGTGPAVAAEAPIVVQAAIDGGAPPAPDLPVVDGKIEMTLDQALAVALERELGLRVERYTRTQTWYNILQIKGIYDLTLDGVVSTLDNTSAQVSRLQASSFKQEAWNLGLGQLIAPLNSRVRVDFDNSRSESDVVFNALNPSFDSSLRLGYTQPLLRNFGRNPGTRALRVARKNDLSTANQFEAQVSATIQNVDFAYWNLVAAREQLYVSQESLSLAQELHSRNKIQVDVGTLAPLELVQSEAAIATREEDIIRAEAAVGDAADQLRQLLDLPPGPAWSAEIVPTTKPETERISIDVEQAIGTALASRPEIRAQQSQIDVLAIDAVFFHDQLKPQLDLDLGYRLNGTGGTLVRDPITGDPLPRPISGGYGDVLDQIRQRDFRGWSASLTLAIPIQNRAAKASDIIAKLNLERGQTVLDQIKLQVTTQVRTAARAVVTAAKQIDAARISVKFQERNLDAEKKRYENGMSTSFRINQVQDDLTQARSREVTAVVNYRTSLANYYGAIGKLLDQENVEVEGPVGDPQPPYGSAAKKQSKALVEAAPVSTESAAPAQSGGAGR